ncbi:unnamed protein product [Clonostachys rhizophaga]|uniref:BAH domain-containing protein n=2 Tax=Clonostachys TaxID=110564 RepID=A0A9N9V6J4_9HYPO|nr:unnamed protein product [Clonostachys rhizophaga]CAI6098197.1 unnamed protein product [Clonostachys chloroleuca]
MPSTKRPRSAADENRAECPFSVQTRPLTAAEQHQNAKKRKGEGHDEDRRSEWQSQAWPYAPIGKMKNNDALDVKYSVSPHVDWQAMTRYNSFVLGKEKFHTDDFVYVANEESIKRLKATPDGSGASQSPRSNDWVARILEIRALNEQNVYARVFWMYWPDELSASTTDGRKTIRGRQPYHGKHELIASNHMDIINAVSVTMAAKVEYWAESDEDDSQSSLYWRQIFNCNTTELTPARPVCKCKTPANPDKMLVGCTNKSCGKWMHDDCLRHDALMRVFDRLGKTTPQVFESASEPGSVEADDKKDVLPDADTDSGDTDNDKQPTKLPTYISPPGAAAPFPAAKKKTTKREPYRGLFEANLRLGDGMTAWHVKDLREGVEGGVKEWYEQVFCLFCEKLVD